MKLTCDDFSNFIDAYIDDEFDDRERMEFDLHLEACEQCRQEVHHHLQFKHQFRAMLGAQSAPESLRRSILEALEREAAPSQAPSPAPAEPLVAAAPSQPKKFGRTGVAIASVAAACTLILVLPGFAIAPATGAAPPAITQTLDWHRGAYPLEIQTSQPAQVSAWFHGKVDFPVRLPPFADDRVKLLGARLAQVEDERAAYVVYEVDGSRMGVMMFQSDGLKVPSERVERIGDHKVARLNAKGYDIALLRDQGVTYALTTQLPPARFTQVMQSAMDRPN